MSEITSFEGLVDEIHLLEIEQAVKRQLLKEQLNITYETLKPINLIKSALTDISTSPYLIDNIMGTAMGVASGFLTKKIFVGASGNLIRKLLGSILQFGVTNVVAQNAETIKSFGQIVFQHLIRNIKMNSK
jgi:hypothetical protein